MVDVHIDGSAFGATLAGYVLSSGFTPQGNHKRPALAVFLGPYTTMRPFIANAMLGKRIREGKHESYEFLKSLEYKWSWQRYGDAVAVTAMLPDIWNVDPGMVDPEGIKFLFALSRAYIAAQVYPEAPRVLELLSRFSFKIKEALSVEHWHETFANAYAFAIYLDRRTRSPIIADPAFYVYLYLLALETQLLGVTNEPDHLHLARYHSYSTNKSAGLENLGYGTVHKMYTSHDAFDSFLAEAVDLYFQGVPNGQD